MPSGYLSSEAPVARYYAIGDGAAGAIEALLLATNGSLQPYNGNSFMYAGVGAGATNGGLSLSLWGAAMPFDGVRVCARACVCALAM